MMNFERIPVQGLNAWMSITLLCNLIIVGWLLQENNMELLDLFAGFYFGKHFIDVNQAPWGKK